MEEPVVVIVVPQLRAVPDRCSAGRWAAVALLAMLLPAAAPQEAQAFAAPARAESNLLEAVKRDPSRARRLCQQLRELNRQGISYTARRAVQQITAQENLSPMDAEVLTTYVVGLHCPDVR